MAEFQNAPRRDTVHLVEEATFDFTLGDGDAALRKLRQAVEQDPQCVAAWHALAEIALASGKTQDALEAGLRAVELDRKDVHIHTTLSRIYVVLGDKEKAEEHGAQARTLGWKAQLKEKPGEDNGMTFNQG